jgi:hypothetical protein
MVLANRCVNRVIRLFGIKRFRGARLPTGIVCGSG